VILKAKNARRRADVNFANIAASTFAHSNLRHKLGGLA